MQGRRNERAGRIVESWEARVDADVNGDGSDGGSDGGDWTHGVERLVLRGCPTCAHLWYLPRVRCPNCGTSESVPVPSPGSGTCVARTVVRGVGPEFGLALVALDEGPLVMGRTTPETDAALPGEHVVLEFCHVRAHTGADSILMPTFRKAAAQ